MRGKGDTRTAVYELAYEDTDVEKEDTCEPGGELLLEFKLYKTSVVFISFLYGIRLNSLTIIKFRPILNFLQFEEKILYFY